MRSPPIASADLALERKPALVFAPWRSEVRREVWVTTGGHAVLSDALRSDLEQAAAAASGRSSVVLDSLVAGLSHQRPPNYARCGDDPGLWARSCAGWTLWLTFTFLEDGAPVERRIAARIVE